MVCGLGDTCILCVFLGPDSRVVGMLYSIYFLLLLGPICLRNRVLLCLFLGVRTCCLDPGLANQLLFLIFFFLRRMCFVLAFYRI